MAVGERDVILERLLQQGQVRRGGSPWLTLVAMLAVGAWMLYLTFYPIVALSVWDLQDPHRAASWLGHVGVRYTLHALALLTLGMLLPSFFLTPPAHNSPGTRTNSLIRRLGSWCVHGLLAIVALVLVCLFTFWLIGMMTSSGGLQLALDAGIGLGAMLLGMWIGFWWQRNRKGLVKQAVVVTASIVVLAIWGRHQLVQDQPLGFAVQRVSVKDKRELMDVLQRDSVTQEGHRVYQITQDDLNKLLAWWITVAGIDGKAKVELKEAARGQQLAASARFPNASEPATYVNLVARGNAEILDERLDLSLDALAIGGIKVPGAAARWLGRLIEDWISSDRDNLDLLTGIVRATADHEGVKVVVSDEGIRTRRVAKMLRQLGDHPDVTRSVRTHLTAFAELQQAAGRDDSLFTPIVRNAFHRAIEDSVSGSAVEANRAAMVALGIALGHYKLERVVGDCWASDARQYVLRLPRQSRLRDRPDWARHFWVSAALTAIVGNRASDAAGLLKEELDSGEGGSGFSFGDLMADRAGTEFARAAVRDESSAHAIQAWVCDRDHDLNQLMPSAADLPEGLAESVMLEQYGGPKGKRYKEMMKELEKRLRGVAWR